MDVMTNYKRGTISTLIYTMLVVTCRSRISVVLLVI